MMFTKKTDEREARKLLKEETIENRWKVGFFNMDSKILAEIPDDYLANLQVGVQPTTGPYIRAQHEWKIRLIKKQIRATIAGSVLGIIGTLFGVLLGWWLSHMSQTNSHEASDNRAQTKIVQPQNTPKPTP
jgi:hypothetical protein